MKREKGSAERSNEFSNESSSSKACMMDDSKVNKLASDATAVCSKCGARAHDPSSLCSPVRISGSG